MPSPWKTPTSRVRHVEDYELFQQALARLPERSREVIELRVCRELDSAETAEEMGLTPVAVRSLLARARASLALEYSRLQQGS